MPSMQGVYRTSLHMQQQQVHSINLLLTRFISLNA